MNVVSITEILIYSLEDCQEPLSTPGVGICKYGCHCHTVSWPPISSYYSAACLHPNAAMIMLKFGERWLSTDLPSCRVPWLNSLEDPLIFERLVTSVHILKLSSQCRHNDSSDFPDGGSGLLMDAGLFASPVGWIWDPKLWARISCQYKNISCPGARSTIYPLHRT